MSAIQHIYEPDRLFLVWHSNAATPITRRVVGELVKADGEYEFQYLTEGDDFQLAMSEGFFGYPAFDLKSKSKKFKGALDVFIKRLPPSKREDFPEYLEQYCLPRDFSGSDFSLLGYTGAKLASDTFELFSDYRDAQAPLDLVSELAGVKYYLNNINDAQEDDPVSLTFEPENEHDTNAIKVSYRGKTIGYINRFAAMTLKYLDVERRIQARIIKKAIKEDSARVFILMNYR